MKAGKLESFKAGWVLGAGFKAEMRESKKDKSISRRGTEHADQSVNMLLFAFASINVISYYEILRGLKHLGSEEKLRRFEDFIEDNELVWIRRETVEEAAEIYAYLKKAGTLIEDADILMASIAIVEDLTLVTNNPNHSERIQGLRLDNWLSDK